MGIELKHWRWRWESGVVICLNAILFHLPLIKIYLIPVRGCPKLTVLLGSFIDKHSRWYPRLEIIYWIINLKVNHYVLDTMVGPKDTRSLESMRRENQEKMQRWVRLLQASSPPNPYSWKVATVRPTSVMEMGLKLECQANGYSPNHILFCLGCITQCLQWT